ncbi:hypothetical protein SAMN05878276_2753 [Aquipseudomonas alcaligenes]|uniref:hypothetical protein n=1 Tax=Aquipseudomonas alcaligenes TaxID=43263 RepID=UPI00095725C6|nr:hypothetical protein [Pseudomonas alcaligenes]SIS16515.1 hypothetical protein SAMN05878276_2753 [Pseudomonas alcaligenes]
MDLAEAETIAKLLLQHGMQAVVAGVVVFLLIKYFLPGYLSEKGKNLATREDIAKITQEVESVKNQYAILLEELKAKHQLRLAAIDKRLEAHQQAFTLWRGLLAEVHGPNIGRQVMTCQSWWEANCLYLEPVAREAFSAAYSSANLHASLLQNRNDVESVKSNWRIIISAGATILEAAQLPGLTTTEMKQLAELQPQPS